MIPRFMLPSFTGTLELDLGPVSRSQHVSNDHAALPCWYPGVRSASRPRLIPVISLVSHTDIFEVVCIGSFVSGHLKTDARG